MHAYSVDHVAFPDCFRTLCDDYTSTGVIKVKFLYVMDTKI